ncbi:MULTISPECIES: hypothetical protein [unclassified Streptomyces]|uniref:hypothetical protein n=1 Tax=unclassified Streptomyces TaxID=2593676 RepID=UPI0036E8F20C
MPEAHDPLRSLFKEAAATGQSRARSVPLSRVTERVERVRRRRILALAVGACLVLSGTGAVVTALLPDSTNTVVPATTPFPRPSPQPSPPHTSPPPVDSPTPGTSTSATTGTPGSSATSGASTAPGSSATPTRSPSSPPS